MRHHSTFRIIYLTILKNYDVPNLEMKAMQDAWNPPNKFVVRQRLNKPYESLLYICFELDTALNKQKLKKVDHLL